MRVWAEPAEVGLEDSLELKFEIQSQERISLESSNYDAPDFEKLNEYSSGSTFQMTWDSSQGGMKSESSQIFTHVLKPKRQGALKIRNIKVVVNGEELKAQDITIAVSAQGSVGSSNPRILPGGGTLRDAGKGRGAKNFFVELELSSDVVYKGQKLIGSFYFYDRTRVTELSIAKYPEFKGFIKEDIDIPILKGRINSQQIVRDGQAWRRSLLAQYALFPLKEGRLQIDPMKLQIHFLGPTSNKDSFETDDPFFGQVFSMLDRARPQQSRIQSESIQVDVKPLPSEGRPATFTGGVGKFEISAEVDKTQLKVDEALTCKLRVSGNGNLGAVTEPIISWPENLELYESKTALMAGKDSFGEKVFEYILIPRAPGKYEIPSTTISYFDVVSGSYQSQSTRPINFEVGPGANINRTISEPGSESRPHEMPQLQGASGDRLERMGENFINFWLNAFENFRARLERWVAAIALLLLIVALWVAHRRIGKRIRLTLGKRIKVRWPDPGSFGATSPFSEVVEFYDICLKNVLDEIDRVTDLGAKALGKDTLLERLEGEWRAPAETTRKLGELIEKCENFRFGALAGIQVENQARGEMRQTLDTAKSLHKEVEKLKKSVIVSDKKINN